MVRGIVLGLVLGLYACSNAHSACGEKIKIANGSEITIPDAVTWDANIEESKQVAMIKKKPFAIYFSAKDEVKVIGENTEAIKAFMQANNNSLPATAMEVPNIIEQVRGMGVGAFVKIAATKENRATVNFYGAEKNLLVLCAPSGEKICAVNCGADAAKEMELCRRELAAWRNLNKQ